MLLACAEVRLAVSSGIRKELQKGGELLQLKRVSLARWQRRVHRTALTCGRHRGGREQRRCCPAGCAVPGRSGTREASRPSPASWASPWHSTCTPSEWVCGWYAGQRSSALKTACGVRHSLGASTCVLQPPRSITDEKLYQLEQLMQQLVQEVRRPGLWHVGHVLAGARTCCR